MAERKNMETFHNFTVDGFRYDIVETSTPHHFILNKFCNAEKICRIVGMESTASGKKKMRFESFKTTACFPNPADRVAIRDAIAFLEKEYEAQ